MTHNFEKQYVATVDLQFVAKKGKYILQQRFDIFEPRSITNKDEPAAYDDLVQWVKADSVWRDVPIKSGEE